MMEVNRTHVHAVFQVCCVGSIPLFLISISYIIYQINFSNVQKLLFYFSNVQCDDMQSKARFTLGSFHAENRAAVLFI